MDSRERVHNFRRMTLKSNEYEVLGMKQPPPGTTVDLNQVYDETRILRQKNGAPVVVTCGDKGALISDPELMWVPSVQIDGEIDATGAGDSFNAGATLALAAGASLAEATVVAHLVASIYHPTTRHDRSRAPGPVAGPIKSLDSTAKGTDLVVRDFSISYLKFPIRMSRNA